MIVNEFPCISETFILNQIIGLKESGHKVDIFAYTKKDDSQNTHAIIDKFQLKIQVKYFPSIPENRTARLWKLFCIIGHKLFTHPILLIRCLDFRSYGFYQSLNNLFQAEILMNKKYDIIHCQYGILGKEWAFVKDVFSSKLVVSFRGYDLARFVKEQGNSVYKILFDRGDSFVPVCKYFAAKLSELGCSKEKIHVVASGINIEQFPYKKRVFGLKNKIRLLSVGRLVEKKGIQYGIRAVGELVKLYPNIQYTIVGTGPMENDFKLLIASLKLENHVKLMGGLNHENMKAIYFQSHIFILPCIQAEDNDQEGIPNVLKEAMATGMPVVSTWHSGINFLDRGCFWKCRIVPDTQCHKYGWRIGLLHKTYPRENCRYHQPASPDAAGLRSPS